MNSGFDAIGHPVPTSRREAAYKWARSLGMTQEGATSVVNSVASKLERDQPYEAQRAALVCLDLTGAYVLMSHLLVGGDDDDQG